VFAILLIVVLLCCILIKIPIKISGPAVMWSDVGVLQVACKDSGSVTSLNVKVGDRVETDQVIATLDQSAIHSKLKAARNKLSALNNYILDIQKLQEKESIQREELKNLSTELMASSTKLNQARVARFQNRKKELKLLYDEELIQFEQFNAMIDRVEEAENRILSDGRLAVNEFRNENRKVSTDTRELLERKLERDRLKSEVELLESHLADQGVLKTRVAGNVVEVTTSVGDYLSPGSPVILVQPDSKESQLTFVLFISSEQVKPVKVGMRTELEVSAFPPTKYGKLLAKVTSVSPMPMSSSGLMEELKNDQLVNRITEAGSPFMVKVDILCDQKTGEFLWSSASNIERELQVGMIGEGSIITRYERLIWLLLPRTE
jgi:HlyD family secretion protein